MKKAKTSSKLHIAFIIMMLLALVSVIVALCLFDYNFDSTFEEMWLRNTPSFILAGVFAALNLVIILSAIVLRIKNDELTRSEVNLAFLITAVLVLETVLCVPIFIAWIVELIHDEISRRKNETV